MPEIQDESDRISCEIPFLAWDERSRSSAHRMTHGNSKFALPIHQVDFIFSRGIETFFLNREEHQVEGEFDEARICRLSCNASYPAAGGRHRLAGGGQRHRSRRDRREYLRHQDREDRSQDNPGRREGDPGGPGGSRGSLRPADELLDSRIADRADE